MSKKFEINEKLIFNYFVEFNNKKTPEYIQFENYFDDFYNFCFKLPLNNMVRDVIKLIMAVLREKHQYQKKRRSHQSYLLQILLKIKKVVNINFHHVDLNLATTTVRKF